MDSLETYTQKVIAQQSQLYAYILTLLADTAAADDVLQEVNLVLCRKANDFVEGTSFDAWAFRIARLQCLAYWKIRARDRLVLDEAVIAQIADRAEVRLGGETHDRTQALRKCLAQLTVQNRELLERRYEVGRSLKQLAERMGRSESSLSQTLYRIRRAVLDCMRLQLSKKEAPAT